MREASWEGAWEAAWSVPGRLRQREGRGSGREAQHRGPVRRAGVPSLALPHKWTGCSLPAVGLAGSVLEATVMRLAVPPGLGTQDSEGRPLTQCHAAAGGCSDASLRIKGLAVSREMPPSGRLCRPPRQPAPRGEPGRLAAENQEVPGRGDGSGSGAALAQGSLAPRQ